MTAKTTIVSFLALTILGFGATQMVFAEETTKLDPSTAEGASCMERIQEDTKRQYDISESDRQRAIGVAISSDEFKSSVGDDSYQYGVITQGWNINPKSCTAGLISTGVHFRATDDNGETREIIVSVDPSTFRATSVKVVNDKDRPIHSGVIPTGNYAGHSIAGNSAETESVYQSALTYNVPTPNDPSQFNCGTTSSTACWASVWAGLTTDENDAMPMVQTGTDSECRGTDCASGRNYYQWFETVNSSGTSTQWTCGTNLLVSAGDSMMAQVTNDKKDGGSNSSYDLFLVNITDNLQCVLSNQSANYGDPKYGLYVYERVRFGSTLAKLAQISDITDAYGTIYYGGSNKGIYTPYNN